MKRTALKMKRISLCVLAALGTVQGLPVWAEEADAAPETGTEAEQHPEGKRVDNARVDLHRIPPSTEALPGAPLPVSGLIRQEAPRQGNEPQAAADCGGTVLPSAAPAGADLPFRITVDGETLETGEPIHEADRQRCTDVALSRADIQVKYDDLAAKPSLNVWATPGVAVRGEPTEFRAYANYVSWLRKVELRIFRRGQRPDETPVTVLPMDWVKPTAWNVPRDAEDTYVYLLRVYDEKGRFDETALKTLSVQSRRRIESDLDKPEREALTGWGENALSLRNIPVKGGTITVSGSQIEPGQQVSALGLPVPVDPKGRFVLRQILPAGPQSVDVEVTQPDGRSLTFRRSLSIPDNDWFYVALADLTLGRNRVNGPAELVTGDTQHYKNETHIDGRGAFYLKGMIKGDWLLTAAADTREQPLQHLFTNFTSKDPRYLLRNIDPNVYYPVYGDDSTTVDGAPTQGKFYVRLEKGDSHVMWGSFRTQWTGSELIQYSRGLYGAGARYRSEDTTSFGEKQTAVDGFAADPGTLAARDEFRGTGGSLYYLRHLDITQGSERVWAEVRDKDSGLVLERKELSASQDYDINYLQGRVLLREPLSSTAGGGGVVFTSSLNGNPVYLVTTYEYVPGVTAVSEFAAGVRASQWITDQIKVGATSYHQGEGGADQTLKGADVTWRMGPGTSIKAEMARSNGTGNGSSTSTTGGFSFDSLTSTGQAATAKRVDASVDLAEVVDGGKGRVQMYWQDKQKGFSSPGQIYLNSEAVRQVGFRGTLPLSERDELVFKGDERNAQTQDASNIEVGLRHKIDEEWTGTLGMRYDKRETIAAAVTQYTQNGSRNDVIARADYRPFRNEEGVPPGTREDWSAYGFVQGTTEHTGNRDVNNRAGLGGSWQLTERVRLLAEGSGGSLGAGGKLGTDYRVNDRSNVYLNYVLETENPDLTYRGQTGTWVSGSEYRVSEGMRLFGENKMTHSAGPQSLTNAFGVDLSPNDRWNYGIKYETGKITNQDGSTLDRDAVGLSLGFKEGKTKFASALEFRNENSSSSGTRHVWLMRNSYGQQLTDAWRLLGRYNFSHSSNTQGAYYDGGYREVVLGAAYRPVSNDRWNTLIKYTNLYNVPTAAQVTAYGTTADYAQKSQVISIDTIYDVMPWLSVGAKYGVRIGDLKYTKTDGEWFSSRADLLVLRADWHFVKEWDAVVELRDLRSHEAKDARAGTLLGVYRHVGEHAKLGVGYNFTTYSDDLTDLSYRSRGFFLNALAKY